MAIWRRRTVPGPADLDQLLALQRAARVLESGFGFTPTGLGSICFRAAEGRVFRDLEYDVRELLGNDAGETVPVEIAEDSYGFTWLLIRRPPEQFRSLVTDLHIASSQFAKTISVRSCSAH